MENKNHTTMDIQYGLAGFVNMGNTCYLNSVLQILSNIPLFRIYFIDKIYHMQIINNLRSKIGNIENIDDIGIISNNMKETISYQLERLLKAIWKTKNSEIPTYKPTSFRRLITKKYESFNNYGQQDASECIDAIFDLVEQDIACTTEFTPQLTSEEIIAYNLFDEYYNHLNSESKSYQEKIEIKLLLRELEEKFIGYAKRYSQLLNLKQTYEKKYSLIDELFSIGNNNIIICSNCGHKRYNYSNEYIIRVEMPSDSPSELEIIEKMKTIVFPFELKQQEQEQNEININKNSLLSVLNNQENTCISDVESISSDESKDGFDMFLDDDSDNNITMSQSIFKPKQDINNFTIPKNLLESHRRTKAINEINASKQYTLEYCLDLYFRKDTVECRCNFCNENKENEKSITLLNIPKYLIIQLKRFELDWVNNVGIKKYQYIKFDEEIDIEKYVDKDLLEHLKTNTKYKLINVINHAGVYGGGHYYAYCKNSIDNTWYSFNDEHVSHISNVVSPNAYILIYEKQDD